MASFVESASNAVSFPFVRRFSPLTKALVALGTYAAWTAITWLLEGRIETFLRPDAVADRLVYTGVANL
ncbi:MAG TPA: hypothetical protein VJ898_11850, partial [Natrialbaceae archaeon]|nr:hypothetical protein [Natrialbaceae archaeon]